MTHDFKPAARHRTIRRSQTGNSLPFFSGLAIGLLVALVVYLRSENSVDPGGVSPATNGPQAQDQTETKEAAKPRFDFYTILPEREVKVSKWEVTVPESEIQPKKEQPAEKEATPAGYMLQLGSYRRFEDADQTKASLAMLGMPAHIERVVINGQDTWYRVRIGPFPEGAQLGLARERLKKNGLNFITLRTNK